MSKRCGWDHRYIPPTLNRSRHGIFAFTEAAVYGIVLELGIKGPQGQLFEFQIIPARLEIL